MLSLWIFCFLRLLFCKTDTHSIASDVSEGSGKDGGSKHKLKIWKKMKKLGGGHKRGPGSASPGSVSPQAQAYLDDGDDLSFSDRFVSTFPGNWGSSAL